MAVTPEQRAQVEQSYQENANPTAAEWKSIASAAGVSVSVAKGIYKQLRESPGGCPPPRRPRSITKEEWETVTGFLRAIIGLHDGELGDQQLRALVDEAIEVCAATQNTCVRPESMSVCFISAYLAVLRASSRQKPSRLLQPIGILGEQCR